MFANWPHIAVSRLSAITLFLDASSHLYMRSCPMDGWSVGPSVTRFFLNAENEQFSSLGQPNIDIGECVWCAGCILMC